MRSLTLSLMLTLMLPLSANAATETFFRWRDANGVVHVSNRPDRSPGTAARVELESRAPAAAPLHAARAATAMAPASEGDECPPADTSGLVEAVEERLALTGHLADADSIEQQRLAPIDRGVDTLLVAGEPVRLKPGSRVVLARRQYADEPLTLSWRFNPDGWDRGRGVYVVDVGPFVVDELARRTAPLEQAAIAYPASQGCPARPPLTRYEVGSTRHSRRSICDDFRRAFAEVGVSASRDREVARSFRVAAERFAAVRAGGYAVTVPPLYGVDDSRTRLAFSTFRSTERALDPIAFVSPIVRGPTELRLPTWIVEAHLAQLDELATETTDLVDELTVALAEIDRAARARGCW